MGPSVYLIGAGPGDPGLLTLRGAECLRRADVVLYDGLSNPRLLDHAVGAERICVGKHGQSSIWSQEQINAEMIRQVRAGRRVARLKGGDPAVFARTAEEVEALRQAGIRFEIIPGITAALAAGSYAGIPLTHRRHASAVALVTGQEEPGKSRSALDWVALARFPGTLVVYMGVTTVRDWTTALIAAGKPPDTPASILRRCSMPDQRSIPCRLDQVAELLTPATKVRPPVIVIIGEVTRLASEMSWFDNRPLFGQTVLITRSEHQADELASPLADLGAELLTQPAIEISPLVDFSDLDTQIETLRSYDWLVFTSRNGVRHFFERLFAVGKDARQLAGVRLAAVGKRTGAALSEYHLRPDLEAVGMNAESLADQLARHGTAPFTSPAAAEFSAPDAAAPRRSLGQQVLWVRADRGPDTLADRLRAAGAIVRPVVAYHHRDVPEADPAIRDRLAMGQIDWVTVTSDAIAKSLIRLFGDDLRRTKLASLSPGITRTLTELGHEASVQAAIPTMDALATAIAEGGETVS